MSRRYAAAGATLAGALAPAAKSGISQITRMLGRDAYNRLSRMVARKAKRAPKSKYQRAARRLAVSHDPKLHRTVKLSSDATPLEAILEKSNFLESLHLTQISQGSTINLRERQIIHLNGFRVNFFIQNNDATPMLGRWAILQNRQTTGYDIGDIGVDLFRGTSDQRAVDFNSIPNLQQRMNQPFNTMKYRVISQGKFRLAPGKPFDNSLTPIYQDNVTDSQFILDRYFPYNGTIRYQSSESTSCTNPLIFIFYAIRTDDDSGTPSTQNQILFRLASMQYFVD